MNQYYMYDKYKAWLPEFLKDLDEDAIAELDEFLHDVYDNAHLIGYNEGFYFGH